MGRAGRRVGTVAALVAGALPFGLGVGTAAADDFYGQVFSREHTFTAGNGTQVTCTFSGESSLTYASGTPTAEGSALTRASGEHPACGATFVQVLVTYVDGSGRQRTTGADSVDGDVRWFGEDVASDFSVVHRVSFDDCLSNCDTSFTTSPK
jgi:hypothetical protein